MSRKALPNLVFHMNNFLILISISLLPPPSPTSQFLFLTMSLSWVGFTEFSKLTKGLSAVLVLGYLLTFHFPWTLKYLALVPARTIPFGWNVLTAGYIEQSLFGLILSIFGLLVSGKLLEPLWTSREFTKFIVFTNIVTIIGVHFTAIGAFYITRRERFLYMRLSGFYGVLSGFLVGVKQTMPDQEIDLPGGFQMKAQWLPSLHVLMSVVLSCITSKAMRYLPFVIYGTYGSWIYLRYLQKNPETNLSGDPHEEFDFATFFPEFLRPVVIPIASIPHKLFCERKTRYQREDGYLSNCSEDPEASMISNVGALDDRPRQEIKDSNFEDVHAQ